MNKEMRALREGLTAAGIKWYDDSTTISNNTGIFRTKFINKYGQKCSVIYGVGVSYGWNDGLLESMPPVHLNNFYADEVEGWLTANDIIEAWI